MYYINIENRNANTGSNPVLITVKLKRMVYLVFIHLGFNGATLLESKVFNNEAKAIAYKKQLESKEVYGEVRIKAYMVE